MGGDSFKKKHKKKVDPLANLYYSKKLYNKSYFKNTFPPRGSAKSTSTLCARSAASVEAGVVRESGAYSAYVSILRTSQMPKEPC